MEILMEYLARGFLIMLSISMPCVLVAAGIGLVVGILQAVTQVQEQTIAAAPKILGVFLVIIIGGVGFTRLLTNLFQEGAVIAFTTVPQSENYVLDSNYHKYTSPFASEMKDKFKNRDDIDYIMKNPGKIPYIDKYQREKYNKASNQPMPRPDLVETKKILGR
ncbi:flagellar biosynthetic protein FliQ [bacterium]|nr:flagellar biosynthetic protein FliQ [bacterium]